MFISPAERGKVSCRELKRRVGIRQFDWMTFFEHLVVEFVTTSSFTIWRWSRCSFVLSSEAIGLADCCVSSVSPYLRSFQFAIPKNCVLVTYHSVP